MFDDVEGCVWLILSKEALIKRFSAESSQEATSANIVKHRSNFPVADVTATSIHDLANSCGSGQGYETRVCVCATCVVSVAKCVSNYLCFPYHPV